MRVGYLGPPGTFCEEALLELLGTDAELEEIPYPTVVDCFRAVREGEVPQAIVPIENTIEGSVNQTLDQLAADGDVWIRGEVILPVRHHLMTAPGTGLDGIASARSARTTPRPTAKSAPTDISTSRRTAAWRASG